MAERGYYYGSLGRQALASSYSTLDGVPFKIAPNFRQPPKVINLPVLEGSGACPAFDEEYTFETEEGVLAWARDVDEANQRAKQEEAEKALKREAALKQNEISTDSESDESVQNDQNFPKSQTNHVDERVQAGPQNNINKQSPLTVGLPAVPTKLPIPKPAPRPGSILKPTPIQPVNKTSDGNESIGGKTTDPPSVSNERFDITMFEQEADPFENLELQTINDMEELKVLLDSSSNHASTGGKGDPKQCNGINQMNIPVTGSATDANNSEGFYELAGPINTSAWVTFDNPDPSQSQGSPTFSTDSNKGGPMVTSSDSSASDGGDYVKLIPGEIQPPPASNPSQNESGLPPSSEQTANLSTQQGNQVLFGSQLPPHLASSGLFKPVLPPIPKPRQSALNGSVNNNNNIMTETVSDQANPFMTGPSIPRYNQDNALKTNQSYLAGVNKSNGLQPARIAPPPPMPKPTAVAPQANNSAKMWSSVGPSLASSLEDADKTNPYSRHSREWHGASKSPDLTQGNSTSPVPADKLTQSSSSSQLWNRYRPLPPAPSPPNPPDVQALPQRPSSQALGLTDPYYSLSKEAQAFTDRVTSMGFLRAKVARAVEKFGQDEKEVLDHLIAVDMLEQKKFAPLYAEIALHSCHNDCEKAERFLTMQSQFEELGFTSEKIQDALIKSDMDHDKALDLLTACSP